MNNLLQMTFSLAIYCSDNDDELPPNAVYPSHRYSSWVQGWLNFALPVQDNTDTVYLMESHLRDYHRSFGIGNVRGTEVFQFTEVNIFQE